MELPSLSRQTDMRQTGLSMVPLLNSTFFDLRSAISASRSSTSNAIVPPLFALGCSPVKLVSARQPPPGRSYSIHHLSL